MYNIQFDNNIKNALEEKITTEIKKQKEAKDKEKLRDTCEKFEAIFLEKIWNEMKKSVSADGIFKDSINNRYVELFDYDFCLKMAKGGGIGLADFLFNSLIARLEQKSDLTQIEQKQIKGPSNNKDTIRYDEISKFEVKEHRNLTDKVNEIAKKIEQRTQKQIEDLPLPVEGEISSTFGWRQDPFLKDIRWHNGVDIAAPTGTPIKSVTWGKVVFAGEKPGYGNVVIIKNSDDEEIIYAHNEKNLVKIGDEVKKGDIIAYVGSSGRSTGPHVHFEVRINDRPVDPLPFIYSNYAKTLATNSKETIYEKDNRIS